ncbi:hypothetical protein QTP70_025760 [Hemibagrus guttatus]|uniref:Uncharacterized protein n=1 Tax=Hemibagrus guttatus TaxID=175788 RepID=A0AAE0RA73_9TELE|nr:hypothetical protein QTP70_025760 [Hemibagrus guttatus]
MRYCSATLARALARAKL